MRTALAVLLFLGACGGDDDDDSDPADGATTTDGSQADGPAGADGSSADAPAPDGAPADADLPDAPPPVPRWATVFMFEADVPGLPQGLAGARVLDAEVFFGTPTMTIGPCTVYSSATVATEGSAGTISLTGGITPVTLEFMAGYVPAEVPPPDLFVPGDEITATAEGGPEMDAFVLGAVAPDALVATLPTSLSRSSEAVITWTAGAATEIAVEIYAIEEMSVICRSVDGGSLTIPQEVTELFPVGSGKTMLIRRTEIQSADVGVSRAELWVGSMIFGTVDIVP